MMEASAKVPRSEIIDPGLALVAVCARWSAYSRGQRPPALPGCAAAKAPPHGGAGLCAPSTWKRESRQARNGATVARKGVAGLFLFVGFVAERRRHRLVSAEDVWLEGNMPLPPSPHSRLALASPRGLNTTLLPRRFLRHALHPRPPSRRFRQPARAAWNRSAAGGRCPAKRDHRRGARSMKRAGLRHLVCAHVRESLRHKGFLVSWSKRTNSSSVSTSAKRA